MVSGLTSGAFHCRRLPGRPPGPRDSLVRATNAHIDRCCIRQVVPIGAQAPRLFVLHAPVQLCLNKMPSGCMVSLILMSLYCRRCYSPSPKAMCF
jgi:hypothetical protein